MRRRAGAGCVIGWLSVGALTSCVGDPRDPPSGDGPAASVVVIGSDTTSLADALDLAVATHFSGDYRGAIDLLTPILDRARRDTDVEAEARALTYLGLAAWRLAEYDDADRFGLEALRLKVEHGITDDLYASHNALGLLRYYQNRYPESVEHFHQALAWADESGRRGAFAIARQNLALVQLEWGDFGAAREGFLAMRDSMLAFGHELEPPQGARGLGAALTNLGMLEIRIGSPAAAVDWLLQAVDVYREGYPRGEGIPLGHLPLAYSMLGDYSEAFAVLDTSLRLAREQGLRQEEAGNLEVLADLYREAGDHGRALDLYAEANLINTDIGETVAMGTNSRFEAEIHLSLGAPERALLGAQNALRIHTEAGAAFEEFYDYLTLAEVHQELGQLEEVRSRIASATRLAETLAVRSARVAVALAEASLAERRSDAPEVFSALGRIERDVEQIGYDAQWRSRYLASRAFRMANMPDSAAVAGRQALAMVERVRNSYGSGGLGTTFATDRRVVYANLVEVLIEQGQVEEAFLVSDAARGRVLAEGVLAAGQFGPSASGELRLRAIDGVQEAIQLIESGETSWGDPEVDGTALEALYARLHGLRQAYETSLLVRRRGDARRVAAPRSMAPEHWLRLHSALAKDEVLIEYFVPDEGLVKIFVVTAGGVSVVNSSITVVNLRSRTRLVRGLLSSRDENASRSMNVLAGLHESLIRPLVEAGYLDGVRALVVVPHDVLAYSPVSAWLDAATGRYLGDEYQVRILPSAAALLGGELTSDVTKPTTVVFAPLSAELPSSIDEAKAVAAAVSGATLLIDERATEAAFRRALQLEGSVLHVASHGIMNAHNPMFSRILFSAGASPGSDDDGRFEVHELFGLEAKAALVFLSGCETAVGRAGSTHFSPGEDYMTLAQAFLQAGVQEVIATLWRVDDRAAAVFAGLFYDALKSGSSGFALAKAQRDMRADPRYAAPYYWAGYQLLGRSRTPSLAQ